MKVLHVAYEMARASGVGTFIRELSRELSKLGIDNDVAVETDGNLLPETIDADIVHIHGVWRPYFHRIAVKAIEQDVSIVWSTHGMTAPWSMANKKCKKLIAWWLYQRRDLKNASCIHSTTEMERCWNRDLGVLCKDEVIAPLGVRIKEYSHQSPTHNSHSTKTLLFVSRVQRKKGLPNLLEAWTRLPNELKKDWVVRIVGPDEDGHMAELKAQADKLGILNEVAFVGPKYNTELELEYDNADLFVLPTHSENFGSVVIEALAHNVPVICTKEAPWEELETHKCGWWIDDNVAALVDALCSALGTPTSTLEEMGRCGRALVELKYTWPAVAKIMLNCYKKLCHEN